MRNIINNFIRGTETANFEQKLYMGVCVISILVFPGILISNLINHLFTDTVLCGLFFIGSVVFYAIARFRNRYFFLGYYFFLVFFGLIIYANDNGIQGSISIMMIVPLILALTYTHTKWHLRILGFHLVIYLIAFSMDLWFPWLITNPYVSKRMLYMDLIVGITFTAILCFLFINFLRKSYDHERELNRSHTAKLEKVNEQKSQFFINLSHEIKTPLTLIDNYLEKYIQRKGEDEELIIVRHNIKKMRRDILEYLNIENLENGNLSYEKQEVVYLSTFLQEKIILFMPYMESKGVKASCQIEPDVYAKVNPAGIDQVLNNLLDNAVKYSPEGGIINIGLKAESKSCSLTVRNTANYIPDDQLAYLFEPFYQLSGKKLNAQGIGMGLYIVKKILDSIGGRISVQSSKDDGITFNVSLPLSHNRDEAITPELSIPLINQKLNSSLISDSKYLTTRMNLFVVEDNVDLLKYLTEELSDEYNVFIANNGKTALERLETIPAPELIISDIMMDEMNGYEFLERTLNDDRYAHIPFVFLSAKDTLEERVTGLKLGALDFITKPFSIFELKMKIKAIIQERKRISEAAIRGAKKEFASSYSGARQKTEDAFEVNVKKFNLTEREKEIALLIKQGLKYVEIAEKLHISEHTVTRHVQNIHSKTNSTTKIILIDKLFS